jgi:hypothetical protein
MRQNLSALLTKPLPYLLDGVDKDLPRLGALFVRDHRVGGDEEVAELSGGLLLRQYLYLCTSKSK